MDRHCGFLVATRQRTPHRAAAVSATIAVVQSGLDATTGWQYSPYSLVLGLAAILSVVLIFVVWRRRTTPGAVPFALFVLAAAEWAAGAAMEHASVDPLRKMLCAKLEYVGIMSVSVFWLIFVLAYTGRAEWLTRTRLALLGIVPVVTLALVWTNDSHHLVWSWITPSSGTLGAALVYGHGPWFWIAATYTYVLNLAGTIVLFRAILRAPGIYRSQTAALVAGLLVPWISNGLYLSGRSPLRGVDPTPLAFTLAALLYVWGIFRFRVFDLVPVARHAVIESMADGVFVLDARNRVVDINPAARRMIGVANEAIVGESARKLLASWPDVVERYRDVSEARGEVEVETAQGRRWLDLQISPLRGKGDRSPGRLIVVRDITAHKQADEALRAARSEAERANRLKSEFLANVSHEIRTPLNVILGYSRLIEKRAAARLHPDEEVFLTQIHGAGRHLLETVNKIIDMSRFHLEDFRFTSQPMALGDTLKSCVESLRVLADRKGLTLTLAMAPDPLWIVADPYAVRQALTNVIENAIKYTCDGAVDVRLERGGDGGAKVRVRDTGIGIDQEFLPRIFDAFAQEQGGYGRPFEGAGLGLVLAKKFVEASGGRISVESVKGEGSLFTLSFSLAPASMVESIGEPQASHPASQTADHPRVPTLLVEDDPTTQIFMRHLCGRKLDIHVAASADEARRVLEREPIQLVLMDLSIQGPTDGLELTRELRAAPRWRAIPIIAVTAHAYDSDRERSLAAGCDAYVSKPIDPDALLDTIGDVLRRRGRR